MSHANTLTEAPDVSYEDFPSTLVVMSYDEAIDGLKDSMVAIENGDIEARFNATTRTADILEQLHMSLDIESGGEIAENLSQLYTYIMVQLPVLNMHNDVVIAQALIDLLTPLRDAWAELDARVRHEVAEAEAMFVAAPVAATVAEHAATAP